MMCSLIIFTPLTAEATTLDDLTTAIDPAIPPSTRNDIQIVYIFITAIIERFLGGLGPLEDRVNFVQVFVDFVRDNNLGKQPVSYHTAHAFTTRLVNDFGEDFLKTLAKGLSHQRRIVDESDVVRADRLASALAGKGDVVSFNTLLNTQNLTSYLISLHA